MHSNYQYKMEMLFYLFCKDLNGQDSMQSIAMHGLLGPFPKEERHKNPHSDQTGTQYKYQSYPDMKSDPQGGNYSLNFVFATKVRKISTALLSYLL